MLRRDIQATEQAGFKDPASYVCLASFRIHPGTDHPCTYLGPKDIGIRRAEVFFLAHNRCWYCGAYCPEEGPLGVRGELDHVVGGLGAQRCYCFENLRVACHSCHVKKTRESEHH